MTSKSVMKEICGFMLLPGISCFKLHSAQCPYPLIASLITHCPHPLLHLTSIVFPVELFCINDFLGEACANQ